MSPILNNHDIHDLSQIHNGITTNGDIKHFNSSESVDIDIPLSVAPTEGFPPVNNTLTDEQLQQQVAELRIETKTEKAYVDNCLCEFCYGCSCFKTSYLNSPFRRTWHNARYNCKLFIEHKYFEGVILFLIAFSSLTLVRYMQSNYSCYFFSFTGWPIHTDLVILTHFYNLNRNKFLP